MLLKHDTHGNRGSVLNVGAIISTVDWTGQRTSHLNFFLQLIRPLEETISND